MLNVFEFAGEYKQVLLPDGSPALDGNGDEMWRYEVSADFYPATIAHMQNQKQRPPAPLGTYWQIFHQQPKSAREAALRHYSECPEDLVEKRFAVLEAARLYFTEMLHQAHGGGTMNIKILRAPDNRYRAAGPKPVVDGLARRVNRWLGISVK